MSNEELIAQAREELMKEVALIDSWLEGTETGEFWTSQDTKDKVIWTRRTLTTHLAEMDEHKAIEHCKNPLCHGPVCSKCGSKETLQVSYPCNDLLTKAKRLLGVK